MSILSIYCWAFFSPVWRSRVWFSQSELMGDSFLSALLRKCTETELGVWEWCLGRRVDWFTVIKQESHNLLWPHLATFLWDRSWELPVGHYLRVATDKEDTVFPILKGHLNAGSCIWRWRSAIRLPISMRLLMCPPSSSCPQGNKGPGCVAERDQSQQSPFFVFPDLDALRNLACFMI